MKEPSSSMLKTPAPSLGGADWNPKPPNIGQFVCPCSNSQTRLMQYTQTNKQVLYKNTTFQGFEFALICKVGLCLLLRTGFDSGSWSVCAEFVLVTT